MKMPANYRGRIIRYSTEGRHPGYVQLVEEGNGRERTHAVSAERLRDFKSLRHGPAIRPTESATFAFHQNITNDEEEKKLLILILFSQFTLHLVE